MRLRPAPSGQSVPFLDLRPSHAELRDELLRAFGEVIDASAFINGPQVAEFESAFAEYCGAPAAVGVASGLDALRLALLAAGIEEGDGVVVPANTFVATWEAVSQAGGVPVPVDVTESDYNLDVEAVERALGSGVRFVMPVHLYGQLADMSAVATVAERGSVRIVEDACQAHGASRDGVRAGERSLAAAFSFYPGKNLGAMGDAGALVTADEDLAARVRALREHGQFAKYRHDLEGYTARLDTLQALVLLRKLPLLDRWNAQRGRAAAFYDDALAGIGDLRLPNVPAGSEPVWHLYVVRTAHVDALVEFLGELGIGTGRHYPEPPHLSRAYAHLGYGPGDFPVTEALAPELLSLPIFPGISEDQLEAVAAAVREFFART